MGSVNFDGGVYRTADGTKIIMHSIYTREDGRTVITFAYPDGTIHIHSLDDYNKEFFENDWC